MLFPDRLYPRAFPDVAGALADEINKAYQLGIVSGDIYARFYPDRLVSRAAFAKMVVNAVELLTGEELPAPDPGFPDVPAEHTLYEYVAKAKEAGYIQGSSDGRFHPDAPIRREQMAAILQRVARLMGQPERFDDVPDGSPFAGAIGAVSAAGLMHGYTRTEFGYGDPATRGQGAAVVLRLYEYCKSMGCQE